MSKVEYGSITVVSTGNKTPSLADSSLVVERILFFISSSSTEASSGYHDSSVDFTGSSAYQEENLTKSITHYRNVGGVKTKVFEGLVTSMGTGEFTINVSTRTENTVLRFVVFGS